MANLKHLVVQLTRREIVGRYRGSLFGLAWSFFNPLLMLAVYTFVFGVVLPARWQTGGGHGAFAINLFAGLIIFNLFAECITRAPGLILANVSYVKKVVFPLEILPLTVVLAALFHAVVSLIILFLFYLFVVGPPPWTLLLIPLVWAPLALMILGLSWFLASLGVYIRDIGQVIGVLVTALLFLSPVFYPATSLPAFVRGWAMLNPLTLPIMQTRQVVLNGIMPDWSLWAAYSAAGLMCAWLGYVWFRKTRRGFGDVI